MNHLSGIPNDIEKAWEVEADIHELLQELSNFMLPMLARELRDIHGQLEGIVSSLREQAESDKNEAANARADILEEQRRESQQ